LGIENYTQDVKQVTSAAKFQSVDYYIISSHGNRTKSKEYEDYLISFSINIHTWPIQLSI